MDAQEGYRWLIKLCAGAVIVGCVWYLMPSTKTPTSGPEPNHVWRVTVDFSDKFFGAHGVVRSFEDEAQFRAAWICQETYPDNDATRTSCLAETMTRGGVTSPWVPEHTPVDILGDAVVSLGKRRTHYLKKVRIKSGEFMGRVLFIRTHNIVLRP